MAGRHGAHGTRVDLGDGQHPNLPHALPAAQSDTLVLGARPEHIAVAPAGHGLPAGVGFVEHLGDHQVVHASLPNRSVKVVAEVPVGVRLEGGDGVVGLRFDAEGCHLFRADGVALR